VLVVIMLASIGAIFVSSEARVRPVGLKGVG